MSVFKNSLISILLIFIIYMVLIAFFPYNIFCFISYTANYRTVIFFLVYVCSCLSFFFICIYIIFLFSSFINFKVYLIFSQIMHLYSCFRFNNIFKNNNQDLEEEVIFVVFALSVLF